LAPDEGIGTPFPLLHTIFPFGAVLSCGVVPRFQTSGYSACRRHAPKGQFRAHRQTGPSFRLMRTGRRVAGKITWRCGAGGCEPAVPFLWHVGALGC
jgi:hypothetical protein